MNINPVEVIRRKRDGMALNAAEIEAFINGAVKGLIPEYQTTAFLMATFFRGMGRRTVALTRDDRERTISDVRRRAKDRQAFDGRRGRQVSSSGPWSHFDPGRPAAHAPRWKASRLQSKESRTRSSISSRNMAWR